MSQYTVVYTQYYAYTVEANSGNEAQSLAYDMFETDMRSPVANTFYDEVEIECVE